MSKFLTLSQGLMFFGIAFFFITLPFIINTRLTSIEKSVNLQLTDSRSDVTKWLGTTDNRIDNIQGSVTSWLTLADGRISSIQKTADRRIGSLERTTDKRVASLETKTFDQIGKLQTQSFETIKVVSTKLDTQVSTLNDNMGILTKAYAGIPEIVGKRFDTQTDCTVNQLCWQNMASSILRDGRYAALDISSASLEFKKGFPTIVGNVTNITGSVAKTSENFARITAPHWYDRLLGYGINGALLYREFHPATLAVKEVTQVIASQK